MKVIIIEHDKYQIENINTSLKIRWPDCQCFSTEYGIEGIDLASNVNPDLVILDLEVTDMDGLEVIKETRKVSIVPLIALSRIRDDQALVVKALHHGADRFISKPFRALEFLSRVNALLRRIGGGKHYQHALDMDKVLAGSISIKEAKQAQEENRYLETSSVN